ncbi:MAG: right-handed parallel beta-helix repeat-containing protein [Candidatus Babeliales bacterium]|jgi:hypothetical protein
MSLTHRKHVERHKHTANDIVGNYVSAAKTGASSSFPSYIDYLTITKKLTVKDPATVDGDYIELNVLMLEDPAFPGVYNPFLEISEGILCHKDIESYGGFVGSASAAGVTGGGCVQIGDRFEDMSDPSRINLTGASDYVAITKGSTIGGGSWDLNAVLADLKCDTIYADVIKKVNGDSWNLSDKPSNVYDYKTIKNGNYYEALDSNGVLTYGGSADAGGVSGTNFAAIMNQCLQDISDDGGGTIFMEVAEYLVTEQIVIPGVLTPEAGQERLIEIVSNGAVLKIHEDLEADAIYCNSSTVFHMARFRGFDVWVHSHDPTYYAIRLLNMRGIYFEDIISGWSGTYLQNCILVWFNNFEAVDSCNEGLRIQGGGYMFGNNFFIDNCGGWGGNEGYNAILLEGTSRIYFTNLNLFGEKGVYGGQDSGLYLSNTGFCSFSNFQIDGFEDSGIRISGCTRLNFSNFEIINSGSHPVQITSETDYKVEDLSFSNFKVFVSGNMDGIGIYAQNIQYVKSITISNGMISGTGDGVVINDDNSANATCTNICVNNLNIDVTGFAVSEGGNSDYNLFSNINGRTCPSGVLTSGTHTKITNSWDYTNFISDDVIPFTVGVGGVSANDVVAIQLDNTIYKALFSTNGEKVIGVAQQTKAAGQTALVKIRNIATVVADAAVNPGDRIAASNSTAGRATVYNSHSHSVSIQASTEGTHNHEDTSVDGNHQHGSGTLAAVADDAHTHTVDSSGSNDLTHHHDVYVASTPITVDSSDGLGTKTIAVSGTTASGSHAHSISGSADTAGSHQHTTYDGGSHYHDITGNTGNHSNGVIIGKALTSAAGAGNSFNILITHGA